MCGYLIIILLSLFLLIDSCVMCLCVVAGCRLPMSTTEEPKTEGKKAGKDAPPVSIGWDSHKPVVRVYMCVYGMVLVRSCRTPQRVCWWLVDSSERTHIDRPSRALVLMYVLFCSVLFFSFSNVFIPIIIGRRSGFSGP